MIDFRSFFDNQGNFTSGEYFNTEGAIETDGIEVNGEVNTDFNLNLSGNYTYMRRLNNTQLFNVPENKYGFSASYDGIKNLNMGIKHLHVGETMQPAFPENVRLSAYDLIDFFASYKWNQITVSGAINNLMDENYQAQYGFNAIGRNYSIRMNYQFN